jgi:hypothetical protein
MESHGSPQGRDSLVAWDTRFCLAPRRFICQLAPGKIPIGAEYAPGMPMSWIRGGLMLGENHRRVRRCSTILFLFLLPALLAGCWGSDLKFPTEYQAVFLNTGQVFFGRLEDTGSPYLTLRDVFYIAQQAAPDKKATQSLLLKRGGEAHGPDFMRINARHVVLIEPVTPDSRVAQLILEAHKPPAAAPKEEPNPAPGK